MIVFGFVGLKGACNLGFFENGHRQNLWESVERAIKEPSRWSCFLTMAIST